MKEQSAIERDHVTFYWGILILIGLYFTSLYNYLLFHSLAEIFSIIIACSIFIITWNSRRFLDNNCLLFLGSAYLFVGGLDLLHLLAYKGMGVFTGYGANLPTQLWIAARYVESLSLFISIFLFEKKLSMEILFLGYTLVTSLILGFVFYWDLFPVCFVEEIGLTPFKKISEYIISLILIVTVVILLKRSSWFDPKVLRLLIVSIFLTIISELAFAVYFDVYGLFNLLGHYFKIISFYLVYKGIVKTGLTKPYTVLFRNLKKSEASLRSAGAKLEQRVDERTAELFRANKQLKKEIEERIHAQENFRMLADRLLEAQESERRRLAREMHDDMTQRLAVLAIDAGKLEQELQSAPGPTLERLRQMRESLIKLSEDIHAISRRLHPSIIDDLGLVDAVESECTNFSRRYRIPVNWSAEEIRPDIPKDIALSIYRVVQESLRNAAKHARASEITVALTGNENFIHLYVQDNGVGFDLKSEKRTLGLGLASMKERIHLIQGDFSIRSRKGQGTILEIQVPAT
jgi:signal transduction histidine kinase